MNGQFIIVELFAYSDTHTEAKTFVLENELEACQILLEEEPDNKCTNINFFGIILSIVILSA